MADAKPPLRDDMSDNASEKQEYYNKQNIGRRRPEAFSSTAMEIAFVTCMLGALTMAVSLPKPSLASAHLH